jgi:hypothetical protein
MRRTTSEVPAALALSLVLALAAGARPVAAEKPPRYQFDRAFDFSRLHSYDVRIHESKQREGAMVESIQPRFVALLEELLNAKGYHVDTERPDFVLTFDTMVADDFEWTSWSGHAEVAKGLLVLRMTEPAQEEPFWMGADSAELTGKITPDKAWKKADRAARRILGGFPPPRE